MLFYRTVICQGTKIKFKILTKEKSQTTNIYIIYII